MTTKGNICETRRDGSPCELFIAGPRRCQLITCCSDADLPSPAQFEAEVHSPNSKCRHAEGDFWEGVAPDPLPNGMRHGGTEARRHEGTPLNGLQLMVLQRACCCKGDRERDRCVEHFTGSFKRRDPVESTDSEIVDIAPWGCRAIMAGNGEPSKDIRPQIKDPSWGCPKGLFAAVTEGQR